MSSPVGNAVSRHVGFENFLKEQANTEAKKYTAPAKNALGAYSDASIEKSHSCSKNIFAKTFSSTAADIMAKSIDIAKPISKQAAQTSIHTSIDLTTSALVNKTVNWITKH
ncbi:hypothetical protein RHABOEDO_000107 [Candidatus Rhabdochlamydia oedothoracis]|uniref:Uncharacterized protein n=1 Tax=Candidatus Rhabdochlamydia oedothoracis TaxID=2720720 RepID=A0ABX8UYH8_9BACT|nr:MULTISPECIES: hypothetical protein [Rhabdochlamydia]KAG6559609.1 hypothetical protein RHOW815_000365 [Candidatus Rhabdochlamydia sp. W815]QYF48018.1 hypothetical protein RHABOEDO_000107 [Candidatus Rhabdochlamydia oedothoracis]